MRVTHVITRLIVGGAQENTIATVLGLSKKPCIDVTLLTGPTFGAEGSLVSIFDNNPGIMQEVSHLTRPVHPWKDILACRQLWSHFLKQKPDVVHTHSGKAGILGRFAARQAKVPMIIHSIHGPSFGAFQGLSANLFFRQAERSAASITHHFISVAQAMTDQYLSAGIGKKCQFTRIFSGFRLEPYLEIGPVEKYRNRWGLTSDDFVIGKIARLAPLKGHDDLLESAVQLLPKIPRLKVLLIGDGILKSQLETRIRRMGLTDTVVFAGLVQPHEVPACLGAMDAIVHLSRREGLPRALSQALAAGRPVVAYDCDGAREVCLPGLTGYLVSPGDILNVTQALYELYRLPIRRKELGDYGRAYVQAEFSEAHMVDQIHKLYIQLLNTHE